MEYRPSRPVILSGVKHSGKSTVGHILAEKLSLQFHDLDDCVVELCREDRGGDVITWEPREIYRRLGKTGFQNLEFRCLKHLSQINQHPYVLALGGGTPEYDDSRNFLKTMGILVYLHEIPDVLFERIAARGLPPFLDTEDPKKTFNELFTRRDNLYRQEAHIILELNGASAEDAATTLIHMLQEYDYAG